MGKCPNCGNKELVLDRYTCQVCGKEGCTKCMMPLFWLAPDRGSSQSRVTVCSEGCWNDFSGKIKAIIDENLTVASFTTVDGRYTTNALKLAYASYIHENLDVLKTKDDRFRSFLDGWLEDKNQDIRWISNQKGHHESSNRLFYEVREFLLLKERRSRENLLLKEARHHEEEGSYEYAAEKYEQVADLYDEMQLYDEARETREKARQTRGKDKEVIMVDLNKLIQQVKDGGIVAIYRCPRCDAPLKISKDTSLESLRVCEHCGSAIEAVDVANFLRATLS